VGVAPAAATAFGDDKFFIRRHIHNDLIGFRVPDNCATGYLDHKGFAPLAAHTAALTVLTGLGSIFALIAEVQKGGQVVIDF